MSVPVKLHLYDLSRGLAKQFSQALLGKFIEGIWHTGIVYDSIEWYFGGGIFSDLAGQTPYGIPDRVIDLGGTDIPPEIFTEFIEGLRPRFTMQSYDIVKHNCNNFTTEVSTFLTGKPIPQFILDLPEDALDTPFGAMVRPYLEQYRNQVAQFYDPSNDISQTSALNRTFQVADELVNPNSKHQHSHDKLHLPELLERKTPITFTSGNPEQICTKLISFVTESNPSLSLEEKKSLDQIAYICKKKNIDNLSNDGIALLIKMILLLPQDKLFPALDLLRLIAVTKLDIILNNYEKELKQLLLKYHEKSIQHTKANNIMILRLLCNFSNTTRGRKFVLESDITDNVIDILLEGLRDTEPSTHLAGASLAFNISLFLPKDDVNHSIQIISLLVHNLNQNDSILNEDIAFTELLALGNLIYRNTEACDLTRTLDLNLTLLSTSKSQQVQKLAKDLTLLLQ